MDHLFLDDAALRQAAGAVGRSLLDSLPTPSQCQHEFSPEFEARGDALLKKERRRRMSTQIMQRAAAVLLACLIGLSAWLAVDDQARASFLRWVREVRENMVVYRFSGDAPVGALPEYVPGWLPEGYEMSVTVDNDTVFMCVYTNPEDDRDSFVFTYHWIPKNGNVSISDVEISEPVTVNGHSGYYYTGTEQSPSNDLEWIDDKAGIMFSINGFNGKDVMLHIAENIKLAD